MASFSQPPFFTSLIPNPIKNKNYGHSLQPKSFKISSSKSEENSAEGEKLDPVKLAFAKAKSYRSSIKSGVQTPNIVQDPPAKAVAESEGAVVSNIDVGKKEAPSPFQLALEKEKGLKGRNETSVGDKESSKGELSISSMDFVGLGFADKKSSRNLPAGLIPQLDPYPEMESPEVEYLVGDSTNFGDSLPASSVEEETDDLYKPKVSTWGVFPRPNNISKAYGGGRTLRPGETLETPEEKAAKEARTRQLLAAYKTKYGLNIDPKLKSECEKCYRT